MAKVFLEASTFAWTRLDEIVAKKLDGSTHLVEKWITFLGSEMLPVSQRNRPKYIMRFGRNFAVKGRIEGYVQELYIIIGRHNVGEFDSESGWFEPKVTIVGVQMPRNRTWVYCVTGTRLMIYIMTFAKRVNVSANTLKLNHRTPVVDPLTLGTSFKWSERTFIDKYGSIQVHYMVNMLTDPEQSPFYLNMTQGINRVLRPAANEREPARHRYNVYYAITPACGANRPERPTEIHERYDVCQQVIGPRDEPQPRDPPHVAPIQGCVFCTFMTQHQSMKLTNFSRRLMYVRGLALTEGTGVMPSSFPPYEKKGGTAMAATQRADLRLKYANELYPYLNERRQLTANARRVGELVAKEIVDSFEDIDATNDVQVLRSKNNSHMFMYNTSYMSFFPNNYIRTVGRKDLWVYDFGNWDQKEPPPHHWYMYWILVGDDLSPSPYSKGMRLEPRPYFLAKNLPQRYYLFAVSGVHLASKMFCANRINKMTIQPLMPGDYPTPLPKDKYTEGEKMPNFFKWGSDVSEYGPSSARITNYLNSVLNNPDKQNYLMKALRAEYAETLAYGMYLAQDHPRDENQDVRGTRRVWTDIEGWIKYTHFYELDILFKDQLLHAAREFGTQILDFWDEPDQDNKWADTVLYEDPLVERRLRRKPGVERYWKVRPDASERLGVDGLTEDQVAAAAEQYRNLLAAVQGARSVFDAQQLVNSPLNYQVRLAAQEWEQNRGNQQNPYAPRKNDDDRLNKAIELVRVEYEEMIANRAAYEAREQEAMAFTTLSQTALDAIEQDMLNQGTLRMFLYSSRTRADGLEGHEGHGAGHGGGGGGPGDDGGHGGGGGGPGDGGGGGEGRKIGTNKPPLDSTTEERDTEAKMEVPKSKGPKATTKSDLYLPPKSESGAISKRVSTAGGQTATEERQGWTGGGQEWSGGGQEWSGEGQEWSRGGQEWTGEGQEWAGLREEDETQTEEDDIERAKKLSLSGADHSADKAEEERVRKALTEAFRNPGGAPKADTRSDQYQPPKSNSGTITKSSKGSASGSSDLPTGEGKKGKSDTKKGPVQEKEAKDGKFDIVFEVLHTPDKPDPPRDTLGHDLRLPPKRTTKGAAGGLSGQTKSKASGSSDLPTGEGKKGKTPDSSKTGTRPKETGRNQPTKKGTKSGSSSGSKSKGQPAVSEADAAALLLVAQNRENLRLKIERRQPGAPEKRPRGAVALRLPPAPAKRSPGAPAKPTPGAPSMPSPGAPAMPRGILGGLLFVVLSFLILLFTLWSNVNVQADIQPDGSFNGMFPNQMVSLIVAVFTLLVIYFGFLQ